MAEKSIRQLTREELEGREKELRETLARLQMKRHARRLEKPSELHAAKKDLARVLTVLRQKRGAAASGRGAN
jgi:large subunit ribosomal protein L29